MELQPYQDLLAAVKNKIRTAQHRASQAVHAELLSLYWEIGRMIARRQNEAGWSAGVIPKLAADLKNELSEVDVSRC